MQRIFHTCLFTDAMLPVFQLSGVSVMVSACRCLNHGVFFCPYSRKSYILIIL